MPKILIPTPLRPFADKQAAIEIAGGTVGDLLDGLLEKYGDLRRHLFTEEGKLRSFVNIYVNDDDIRYLQNTDTRVESEDVISIVPSIAGGTPETTTQKEGGELSQEEILRYSRHLIMPEVGMDGQMKLRQASVLLIGTGGLGAPLGLYLAAAGVGRLGLVDYDVVDFTNLQRQVAFSTLDVGRRKIDAAYERLSNLNPEIQIDRHETKLTSDNALDLFHDYDIVADGTDNFQTRYLVNDACVLSNTPNVYGSIFRFEGQVSVFGLQDGPCYRCLYPEPPPPGLVPSCAEGGVLGVLPGIIGTMQANEVIKLILGAGESLSGRLLLFDALGMKYRELTLRKDPNCPVCGPNRTVTELIDYEEFCGVSPDETGRATSGVPEIAPAELKQQLDRGEDLFILDVREPHEYQICNLDGYLIPLNDLPRRVHELDSAHEIVVHCRSGQRSAKAVLFLQQAGFAKVKNLAGGILAWSEQVDPTVPKY